VTNKRCSWASVDGPLLLDALNAFQTALTWTETQQRIQVLLESGPQREGDFENRWPALLRTLLET
jgi:hypothetical protein